MLLAMSAAAYAQLDRSVPPEPGPSPEIQIGKYDTFALDNGLQVFVVEDHRLPRVSFQLRIDQDPVREKDFAGYVSMAGELMRRGTTNRTKEQLDEEIDFIGATLSAWSTGMYGSSLKKHSGKVLELMADIIYHASFPEEELEKIKKQRLSELASEKDDPAAILDNVSSVLLYGKSHPYGELVTEETVERITIEKCREYYRMYYRPNKAYLAVVGDISIEEAKPLIKKYFAEWERASEHTYRYARPAAPEKRRVCLVDKPGAVQSSIAVTYPVKFTPGNPDAIKAGVMSNILGGGGFAGRLMQNLREDKGYTYGAYCRLSADEEVGSFGAFANVRNEVTDSAVTEILHEMRRIREEPVPEEELKLNINKMTGSFARSLERPQTVANFALNMAMYDLPEDYYATYLKKLARVSAEDVQQMAQKYILPDNAYVIVVGNRDDVYDKLNTLAVDGKPELYDHYGNEAKDIKPAPEGVTAETVINDYLLKKTGENKLKKARKKLGKIKDVTVKMSVALRGMEFELVTYNKAPNKYAMTFGNESMTIQEQVFDGESGMMKSMQGSQEITGELLEEMKYSSMINPELSYAEMGFVLKLEGIEVLDDKEYYKVKITNPAGKTAVHYFDKSTGLKYKVITTSESQSGTFTQIVGYADYKEVEGVLYPHKITQNVGAQVLTLDVTEVKVNSGLTDAVFKTD